jgi:hypothetical protein
MSRERFEENCEGCKPVIIDMQGHRLPIDSPPVQALRKLFETQPLAVKRAWHAITCRNSRKAKDLKRIEPFQRAMEETLKNLKWGEG